MSTPIELLTPEDAFECGYEQGKQHERSRWLHECAMEDDVDTVVRRMGYGTSHLTSGDGGDQSKPLTPEEALQLMGERIQYPSSTTVILKGKKKPTAEETTALVDELLQYPDTEFSILMRGTITNP